MSDNITETIIEEATNGKFDTIAVLRAETALTIGWHVALGKYSSLGVDVVDSPVGNFFVGKDALEKALQYAYELKKFFRENLSKKLAIHVDPLTSQENTAINNAKASGELGYRT